MNSYHKNNVFAKILMNEIPARRVAENDNALAFFDIAPKAPIHVLIIPKGEYSDAEDFYARASDAEVKDFHNCFLDVLKETGLSEKRSGFRLISNSGKDGRQDVPHYHIHVLGGADLGEG